ncbi:MAG: cysteine synthase A [Clostridia bacterium]|nr:cysteine synthase A [Clostridia bacterium]
MMKVYKNIDGLIGNTPLLEVQNIAREEKLCARLFVKIEGLNPAGSIKDRAALYMINDAEKRGVISAGATIIEATSGNTGIGLSAIGLARGYKVILTMPDTMSKERITLLKAYGAQVVLTDGALGMQGAIDKAKEINKNTPNSVIIGQFSNPANALAHYETTGPEIWAQTEGKVDFFVAGVGSGGTVSGTGKFLKKKNPLVQIIAVEPESSPLISRGVCGKHKIQGIGANFVPALYDSTVVNTVLTASDKDAYYYANLMAKREGVLVGISSGAALSVGVRYAKDPANTDKTIVVILPDTGDRYLSTDLFNE